MNNLEIYMQSVNYSFKRGLQKGVISAILFAIPIAINAFPEWANLSIGGVLVIIANFLKVKYL